MSQITVFEKQHEEISIRVTDADDARTLWLNDTAQSQMLLANPTQLITPYEQVMASWSIFLSDELKTGQALALGLGGGSAVKHICHYYPQWEVTAVEYLDQLAAVTYEYFALPKSRHLTVLIEDAFSLLAQPARLEQTSYDLLLVDLFDAAQKTTYQYPRSFWEHCLGLMTVQSLLVINLWADNEMGFQSVLQQIGEVFSWRVLLAPVAGSGNVVVFAFHPDGGKYNFTALEKQAAKQSALMQLPISDVLQQMVEHNKPQLDRCIVMDLL